MFFSQAPAALNTKQAAEYIDVTNAALKIMRMRGKAPPKRGVIKISYTINDLDIWLENQRRAQMGLSPIYDYDNAPPKPERRPGRPKKTAFMFLVEDAGNMFNNIKNNSHVLAITNHKRVFVIAFIIIFFIVKFVERYEPVFMNLFVK